MFRVSVGLMSSRKRVAFPKTSVMSTSVATFCDPRNRSEPMKPSMGSEVSIWTWIGLFLVDRLSRALSSDRSVRVTAGKVVSYRKFSVFEARMSLSARSVIRGLYVFPALTKTVTLPSWLALTLKV